MERGEGEDVADVVEPVADIIAGEVGAEIAFNVEKVANDVVVFGAVKAADGGVDRLGLGGEGTVDPADHLLAFGEGWIATFGGRHDLAADVLNDFVEFLGIGGNFGGSAKFAEVHSGGGS